MPANGKQTNDIENPMLSEADRKPAAVAEPVSAAASSSATSAVVHDQDGTVILTSRQATMFEVMQYALLLKREWTIKAATRNVILQAMNSGFYAWCDMNENDGVNGPLAGVIGGAIEGLITGGFYADEQMHMFDSRKVLTKSTPGALVALRLMDALLQTV
jgi:hypothetical protein